MRGTTNGNVGSCVRRRLAGLGILVLLASALSGCSDGDDSREGESLGDVRVAEGEAIQIRALLYISDEAGSGYADLRTVRLAVEHYGPIGGFDVHVGVGLNDHCSPDGGRGAAETIIADADVVGVIGTSCSVAAVGAAPLLTGAGIAMISPSNTSPALTSDLAGKPSEHYHAGYYRTAHNDLYQAEAVARFLRVEKGFAAAAALHVGDVYTRSLAEAFARAFERLGGEITGIREVHSAETDMVPALTGIALGSPEALFIPVSETVAESIVRQAPAVAGMDDVLVIAADGLLEDSFMAQPETEGMFFSGPETRFGDNRNESTGMSAEGIVADYEDLYGSAPNSAFWGHAYDATTLLLEAIEAASTVSRGTLRIDRAGVRAYLDGVDGYAGIIGDVTCDSFGDCGVPAIAVIEHLDATDIPASRDNAVYEYAP